MIVIGDTSGLVAAFNSADPEHADVRTAPQRAALIIVSQNRYLAMCLDLTGATNVSLAERYETVAVLTLDRRDFRAVTPLTGHAAFRLLPDDL